MSGYLEDKTFKIRAKQIPWEGYQRAGLLSPEDVGLIQRVSPAVLASVSARSRLDLAYSTHAVRTGNDDVQFLVCAPVEQIIEE